MRQAALAFILLAVALAGSWLPAPVQARARFQEATPSPNTVFATPPPRLTLLFDEELSADDGRVQVLGPAGLRADRDDLQVAGARIWISLLDQGPGAYRVRWTAVADEDQGRARGDYAFYVSPQLPPSAARLTVNPAVAANGQPVALAGSGFTPGGAVVLSVGDDASLLAVARADGRGRFSVQAALLDTLPYGRQVLQAADAADRYATAAIRLPRGGWPAAVVKLSGEAQPDEIDYTLRVENHSGFELRNVVVRLDVPFGARVLAEGLGQPEGVEPPTLEGGQVVWYARAIPAHAMLGPFTVNVLTLGLSGRPTLTANATVEYAHTWEPRFQGSARSEDVRVQVANR